MAKNIYIVLISLCAISIFSTTSAGTDESNGRPSNGIQTHIGFMGSRGKRDISNVENKHSRTQEESNFEEESTAQPFKNTGNLIENDRNDRTDKDMYLRNLPQLSIFKRTPPGFMGMRGKKDFEYSDYSRSDDEYDFDPESLRTKKFFLQGINRGLLFNSLIPKRAPSGFVGMRGKKAFENNKRVTPTSGFYGVRGKKSYLDNDLIYDQLENLLQSRSDLYDEYEQMKRNEKQGFYGMRGRRNNNYLDFYDNDVFDKRASPTGFIGMRGRRFFNDDNGYGDDDIDGHIESVKRQPSSGFFGMRGKKDFNVNEPEEEQQRQLEKRAALAQFFGTRGKKQPFNSGFFGMRGKKQPFEFRGKFVGVRGKKDGHDDNSLHRLELELNDDLPENVKRTPNGFMGMRGKKGSVTDTTDLN